jgi:hypothetical protein
MKKGISFSANPLFLLVGATGFEPATPIPPGHQREKDRAISMLIGRYLAPKSAFVPAQSGA